MESGAIDAVGLKDIACAFDMKETEMSKRGSGYLAANLSIVENYEEKKIVGYTNGGGGVVRTPAPPRLGWGAFVSRMQRKSSRKSTDPPTRGGKGIKHGTRAATATRCWGWPWHVVREAEVG